MFGTSDERSPGAKLGFALLIAALLAVPIFSVWLLVYDRQSQAQFAQESIAEGWAGPQAIGGPLLVIPYRATVEENVTEGGRQVTRSRQVWRELTLSPEIVDFTTEVRPERRKRSIYEVVVYDAEVKGKARFALPQDLARFGVTPQNLALERAELRFGLSDPRGLGANPHVSVGGQPLRLQPGGGTPATDRAGFFAWLDAAPLLGQPIEVSFAFDFRGRSSLGLAPQAGETRWRVHSNWPHPSFKGSFLPDEREVSDAGFTAVYRVGNLALGQSLIATSEPQAPVKEPYNMAERILGAPAQIDLVQPVDLYSRVNRAVKYGFLFIGFTFLAFFLFDVIGGVRVSSVEYLLVGAALVLFFVLLLAFAEVIGFTPAYAAASAAIIGLNTAYSAAVLGSWRRAAFIAGLLIGLYAVLYILLSLEAFALLIGSLLLFVALAAVMYLTRNINWGARGEEQTAV